MTDIKVILGGGKDEWILNEMFTVLKAGKDVTYLSTDMEHLSMIKTQFLTLTNEFEKMNDEKWILLSNRACMMFVQERVRGASGHLIVAHNPTYEMWIEVISPFISRDDTRLIIDYTHPDVPDFIMKLCPQMVDIKVILGGGQDEWILKEMFTVLKAGKDVSFLSTDMEHLSMIKTQFLTPTNEFDKMNDEQWILLSNEARMTFVQEMGRGASGHLMVAHNPTKKMFLEVIWPSFVPLDATRLIIDYTLPDVPDFIKKLCPPSL